MFDRGARVRQAFGYRMVPYHIAEPFLASDLVDLGCSRYAGRAAWPSAKRVARQLTEWGGANLEHRYALSSGEQRPTNRTAPP